VQTLVDSDLAGERTEYIYEKGKKSIGTPNRYRLKLRQRDEEFFRQHIQDENGLDSLLQMDGAQLTDSPKNIQRTGGAHRPHDVSTQARAVG
jgi:hypothetical protein